MKGSTIAAMLLAAAAASAATIVALKKAHDKKTACECDASDYDLTDAFCDCDGSEDDEAEDADTPAEKDAEESAAECCCKDSACATAEEASDEPAEVKLPETEADTEEKSETGEA